VLASPFGLFASTVLMASHLPSHLLSELVTVSALICHRTVAVLNTDCCKTFNPWA